MSCRSTKREFLCPSKRLLLHVETWRIETRHIETRRIESGRIESGRIGFSLVELMVVMVIMGMLVGLAAVRYRSYLISSKQYTAKTQIATIVKAIETFYAQEGRYPTTDEGIQILADGTAAWPDGYLDKVPVDPWKRPYEYISPGSTEPYEVVSLGADGREGGEGENRDISSESLDSDA